MKPSTLFRKICLLIMLAPLLLTGQPEVPTGVSATGYDSHFELSWNPSSDPSLSGFRIYRRILPDGELEYLGFVGKYDTEYIDFIGRQDLNVTYFVSAKDLLGMESELSEGSTAATHEMTDEELLTMVQAYTFRYFWDFAHPVSGMIRERNTTSTVTTGGSGFGVMAIIVGVERGFITYEEGLERVLKIVNFLETADRFHGAWAHWMNGGTGAAIPFSQFDDGGDIVETAFMLQGLLTARQFFKGESDEENELFNKITALWETMDWRWYRKQTQQVLYWHWSPNYGWQINFAIHGFNEAHIVYLLAVAAPINGIPASLYHDGWASVNYTNGNSFYDYPLEVGPNNGGPLFFSHYSYLGFDPRGIKDAYANYFNRNYFHTLINRAYCIDNPENHEGYSDACWGLTASDDPYGYSVHEATTARDNGTITPTAALSSMPYTPTFSIQALKYFYRNRGERLWGEYGFFDAFNLDEDWFASSYLAIDQGPIICMIENYRSGLLWENFMNNPEIPEALETIGFVPDSTQVALKIIDAEEVGLLISPNPVANTGTLELQLPQSTILSIGIYNAEGIFIKKVHPKSLLPAGKTRIDFGVNEMPSGTYFIMVNANRWRTAQLFVVD